MNKSELLLNGVDTRLGQAIELIWKEAALLDGKQYQEWLPLWDEAGKYGVPIDRETKDFDQVLNYVYDDDNMRQLRVQRLTAGYAVSAVDSARTVRTVSRFTLVNASEHEVEVNSAQVLVAYKRDVHTVFAADLTHRIRFDGDYPRITQKVVRLLNSTDTLNGVGFLL